MIKRLAFTLMLSVSVCGQYGQTPKPYLGEQINRAYPLANGIIGYWPMNEGSGNTVSDLSGNGNTGTVLGPTWLGGKFGPALNFVKASSQYVDLGSNTLISSSKPFSIMMWMNLTTWGNTEGPFSFKTDETSGFVSFFLDNPSYLPFAFGGLDGGGWDQFRPIEDFSGQLVGQWNHFAIVYDGVSPTSVTSFTFYLNAINKPLTTTTNFAAHGNVNYLGREGTAVNYFNGMLDLPMIYSRALSASEIVHLHCEPFCMFQREGPELYVTGAPPAGNSQVIFISSVPLIIVVFAGLLTYSGRKVA